MGEFRFRTVIERQTPKALINHQSKLLMLGSCFTEHIGTRLLDRGFNVKVNPMGILFNPASIASLLNRVMSEKPYTDLDLTLYNGVYHCLDFESKRQNVDKDALLKCINQDLKDVVEFASCSDIWIITLGTAWVFERHGNGVVVGNCHKFHPDFFDRRRMSIDEIVEMWRPLCAMKRVIFTVSPVRHLADGLHGNAVSKATLLLAIEQLVNEGVAEYFPSYEIVNDDLRDYRFYDSDMKHPSQLACDYIMDIFSQTYFDKKTLALADENERRSRQQKHRQIL